jgi:hypothetical protein
MLVKAMLWADHYSFCVAPGNVGLLGCFIQISFPSKLKQQNMLGIGIQKRTIELSFTKVDSQQYFLTRNMQVLYGEWSNQSQNIKPFFTVPIKKRKKTLDT